MQISTLFGTHSSDTEKWTCQEHFGTNIGVLRGCFSVKETGKDHRASSLVNKIDGGAVPQFPSPGNLEQVYTCGHMHLLLIRHKPLRSVACLVFSFFPIF